MIRRDDEHDWLLISQVDHARLAAEIAAVWGNESVSPLPMRDVLVAAVRDHDEGWLAWEQAPGIDPQTGHPRDFTEMPMAVSTKIWTRSIEHCARSSPWAGYWVSRHFWWLAAKARQSRAQQPDDLAAIHEFLSAQTARQNIWREEAGRHVSSNEMKTHLETGVRFVQLFDRISLWFCCAASSKPFAIDDPFGCALSFLPQRTTLIPQNAMHVGIEPYPLSVPHLEVSVPARRIPSRPYVDDAALRDALAAAPVARLSWVVGK